MQSAGPALVAMGLINWTAVLQFALRLAGVNSVPVDGSLEETGTPCVTDDETR